jgi:hypothetical protein
LDTKNRFWHSACEGLFLIWDCKGTNLFPLPQNLFTYRLNFASRNPSEQQLLRLRAAKVSRFFTPANPFSEKGQSVYTTR